MNKKVFGKKLSRSRPAREALFSSLSRSLILNGKIVTTRAKAKAVTPLVEKIVSRAKKGDLSGRRRVLGDLDNKKDALTYLYQNIVPAFANRTSGFTKFISLPARKGDNARMVRMEWTDKVGNSEKVTGNSKKKKTETKIEKKPIR